MRVERRRPGGGLSYLEGDPNGNAVGRVGKTNREGWLSLADAIHEFYGVRQEPAPAPAPTPPPEPPPAVSTAAHWGSYAEPDDVDTIRANMLKGERR